MCLQLSGHTGFAPTHGMCAFLVYTAQAPGALQGNCLKRALGCVHLSGLSHSGSGTPQSHRLGWPCVFVPFPGLRRRWHPTPVFLPGKSHGWRNLVGCSSWGREESDTTRRLPFHFHALEKEIATHSSVLAWRIPGTGEPWWAAIYGVAQNRTQLK